MSTLDTVCFLLDLVQPLSCFVPSTNETVISPRTSQVEPTLATCIWETVTAGEGYADDCRRAQLATLVLSSYERLTLQLPGVASLTNRFDTGGLASLSVEIWDECKSACELLDRGRRRGSSADTTIRLEPAIGPIIGAMTIGASTSSAPELQDISPDTHRAVTMDIIQQINAAGTAREQADGTTSLPEDQKSSEGLE